MTAITNINLEKFSSRSCKKRSFFRLHQNGCLCIITLRPPPRWAKWSRGVRTRGLRVGLVGGPRPLLFLGPGFYLREPFRSALDLIITQLLIDFQNKWLNIRLGLKPRYLFRREKQRESAQAIRHSWHVLNQPRCGIFSVAKSQGTLAEMTRWPL